MLRLPQGRQREEVESAVGCDEDDVPSVEERFQRLPDPMYQLDRVGRQSRRTALCQAATA